MKTTQDSAVQRRLLPRWLPSGGSLPEDVWAVRHRGILVLLWAHAAFIPLFALARGYSLGHALVESSVVPITALAATAGLDRRTRTAIASLGLLTSSAILVHLSGGVIEMHFHFFVMVAVVALYQDWIPFLTAIGYVLIHHGMMGAFDPTSVFNHAAAQNHPWLWASIHAFFIAGISVACLVTWSLNERTIEDRKAAEERLLEESLIVETLHGVGMALAADLDTERIMQTVTDAGTALTGASICTVAFDARFDGEGAIRFDDISVDPAAASVAPTGWDRGVVPVRSLLAVPVMSHNGDVLAGLFFGHPDPGAFDNVDERIVVGIAAQASIAFDNARLYESERQARRETEAAAAHLTLLSDASRVLASSLEVDALVRRVAELVAGRVADICVIDLVEPDGTMRRVAATAADSSTSSAEIESHPPDPSNDIHPVIQAMRTEKPVMNPDGRAITAPLIGRHEALGALSISVLPGSHRPLSDEHISMAEELARRAAVAIENARLYGRQRTVAATLQHSLLPDRLPEIPGIDTAARYAAGADVEVGGDWYDVLQLGGGTIAMTMGDVVGRGERAAALMGQLRTAVRAYALDGKPPAAVVTCINNLLLDAGQEYMATLVFAVLDPEAGELRIVNAGHPPPVMVSPDGKASLLEVTSGMPVGAMPSARYVESVVKMLPGSSLLLYTDGLVEERSSPLQKGLEHLRSTVQEAPRDLNQLCTYVMQHAAAAEAAADDVAILAVRLLPLDEHLFMRVPAQPSVLAPLRATMRRWLAQNGASPQETYELVVATGEAASNAIRHAHGPTRAHFEIDASVNGSIEIAVRDEGTWRPPRPSDGGRGLGIIESFVDDVEIVRGERGTEVRMRRRLEGADTTTGATR